MKIKRLFNFGLACLFSLSSLLMVAPSVGATPVNCTWAYNGGGNDNFSNAGNWQNCNGGAPTGSGNEELVFPVAIGISPTANNDLTGASFLDITFSGGSAGSTGYVISGNALSVGNVTDQSTTAGGNQLNVDLTLIGSSQVTFTGTGNSRLIIGDPNDVTAHSLNLASSNPFQVSGTTIASSILGGTTVNATGSGSDGGVDLLADNAGFSGSISATGNSLSLDNANDSAAVVVGSVGVLNGNGSADSITVNAGGTIAPGHSPGCLTAGSQLVINGAYQAEIAGTTACTDYDQITAGGTTDVTGATLNVSLLNGFIPAVGSSFTIIKNTGGSPVTGTFAGLAEGSSFTVGGVTFTITYQGNGENDVVLTVAKVAVAAAAPGTPNTGFAAVLGRPGTVLAITTLAAGMLLFLARRLKPLR